MGYKRMFKWSDEEVIKENDRRLHSGQKLMDTKERYEFERSTLKIEQEPTFLKFSTTITDTDPGNGIVQYNSGTISSVNTIFIDNLDQLGNTQTTMATQTR